MGSMVHGVSAGAAWRLDAGYPWFRVWWSARIHVRIDAMYTVRYYVRTKGTLAHWYTGSLLHGGKGSRIHCLLWLIDYSTRQHARAAGSTGTLVPVLLGSASEASVAPAQGETLCPKLLDRSVIFTFLKIFPNAFKCGITAKVPFLPPFTSTMEIYKSYIYYQGLT